MILLVVTGLQMATIVLLLPRLITILLNDELTDVFVRVIVSYIQTNRARCALYRKILDLLDEESVSGEKAVAELVLYIDEKSYRDF